MARRSNRNLSGVRGPNSALTEFLRVEGITDAFRRRQERGDSTSREQSPADRNDTEESEVLLPSSRLHINENIVNEEEDEEERMIRHAARRKRKAAKRRSGGGFPSDSDNDDDDDEDYSDDDVRGNGFKKFGEDDNCVDCGKIFSMTVYSRYDRARKGYLCEACNEALKQREKAARRNQLNARKKRKKIAQAFR